MNARTGRLRAAPGPHQGLPLWLGDVLAMLVVVFGSVFPGPPSPRLGPAHLLVHMSLTSVLCALLLLLRRRWPIWILAVCLGVYAGTVVGGFPNLGPGIATTIAAFALANRTSRRTALIVDGLVCLIVVILSMTRWEFGAIDPRIFQVGAACGGLGSRGQRTLTPRVLAGRN